MFLSFNEADGPMKTVYLLSEDLKRNPDRVALTQALTLNPNKPFLGLNGTHGLFGSEEWWKNIEERKIPLLLVSGIVKKVYFAGQDSSTGVNSFSLLLDDGSVRDESIYSATAKEDRKLFVVGAKVQIAYVLDELKPGAVSGNETHVETVLEMAISL
ncbi:hypothetical protein ACMGT0_13210 [Pseudomonas sp. RHF3.3-3]|uniref:hypothetical protein n=1 Tax=Pseudomonas sp. RHF3.3-3 TaxID=3396624 RepID=UPI003A8B4316